MTDSKQLSLAARLRVWPATPGGAEDHGDLMVEAADALDALEARLRAAAAPPAAAAAAAIELLDLPLYWQGRANALRQLNAARSAPDDATEQAAAAYQECAAELRAALESRKNSRTALAPAPKALEDQWKPRPD